MAGTITATTSSRKGKGIVRIDCVVEAISVTSIAAKPIGSAFGRLVGVYIDPTYGAGGTMDTSADILLTDALTGAPIISDLTWTTTPNMYRPTGVITTNAGVAVSAATTANDVNRDIFVAGKLNLAQANISSTAAPGLTGLVSFIFEEA